MVGRFLLFKFLLERSAALIYALSTNQAHANFAQAAKVFWPFLGLNEFNAVTMRAGVGIFLYNLPTFVNSQTIAASAAHDYCS
ncbi:MAG: hypothetical protein KF802_16340 [Bdellovibrionaceae bacterium]|nr:hypothetical protein [Pseudobdellovibrionaceae bacterium]